MKNLLLAVARNLGRAWCRLHGVQLGRKVFIHGFPILRCKGGQIFLGDRVTLNAAKWSNPLNDGRSTVIYAGRDACISVGDDAGLSSSRLIANRGISIGEGTLIGAGCVICDSDMHEIPLGSCNPICAAPISIGERVFLGTGCIVLKGVTIGDRAVIGAGSVVAKNIPKDCIAAGNPAEVVRFLEAV